jgi:hypothetical protein
MIDLYELWGKRVEVRLIDGQTFAGKVPGYTSAADNDDTEASIIIIPEKGKMKGDNVELFQSEIVSSKVLN